MEKSHIKLEDRIFLTNSHPEAGLINYIEVKEDSEKYDHQLRQSGNWRPLITGLKHPTYTTYDFTNQLLYVCNCDDILQYQIKFVHSNGEDLIYAFKPEIVVKRVSCGGLALDKFSNLFFVDLESSHIKKMKKADLLGLAEEPAKTDMIESVYQGNLSRTVKNVADIEIEQEYLYWTNDSHSDGRGGVHKAFTEPFLRPEPFQTYEITDITKAQVITTNEHFLFFTGLKDDGGQNQLFV